VRRGSIEPGTPLAVDPHSGQVRVVGDLDSLVAQKVNIRVVATDAGTPAMSTTGVLKLVLKHPELRRAEAGPQAPGTRRDAPPRPDVAPTRRRQPTTNRK